jgi:hypothetical protein
MTIAGGSALAATGPPAATGPAAAAVRSPASPACTVTWVGKAVQPLWTTAKNWSTGTVPGPASDVCIGTGVDVLTNVSISIHSLHLGIDAGIAMQGTSSNPLTAQVATSVDLTPGGASRIDLTFATLTAAQINNQGGTIFTDGTVNLTSPDIVFGQGGSLQAANGTTALTSLPQLSNGTLTGATIDTSGATVVLPGDITHLVSANVGVGANSAIKDAAGKNALTGLTSIDAQSSLLLDSNLALTGSLTSGGNVSVGFQTLAIPGTFTQAQGTLSLEQGMLKASQVTIDPGATLLDRGSVAGNLVNDGFAQASGTARVTGNYTQAAGAKLASGFGGVLAVAGQATLAGEVVSAEVFPRAGDTSPAITFGSLSGGFTSVGLGFTQLTTARAIDVITTPQIVASAATVAPGQTVTVSGQSFGFQTTVRIFLDRVGARPLATTHAGYRGVLSTSVTIPASVKAGTHHLIAVGSNGNQAEIAITVS